MLVPDNRAQGESIGRDLNKRWQEFARFSAARQNDAALVIPCLDEGARLTTLLGRISSLGLIDLVDILVVDGNSTEQPPDSDELFSLGVSCGIVYEGNRGLSGQLQLAYSACLAMDYEYILTIDGNNKDDPEGIPRILSTLKAGYDFVQGSRFVAGGSHTRTPLLRLLAVRLIHAPILSWSSGKNWTDTTQGFRGYRAEMLKDARLRVLDTKFANYSLLAYLNHRSPQLGFRAVEIGTRRNYPKGKTPTKISALRGNWGVLADLMKVAFGHYDNI